MIYVYTYIYTHMYTYTYIDIDILGMITLHGEIPSLSLKKKWTTFGGEDDTLLRRAFALRSAKGADVEAALRPGKCDGGLCCGISREK